MGVKSGVRFGHQEIQLEPNRFEIHIPPGITTKQELLQILDKGLKLPDYFGMNWDALDETIQDLSWLPRGQVVLRHADVPLAADPRSQSTYLSILNDAVAHWVNSADRDLLVTFPTEFRTEVEQQR